MMYEFYNLLENKKLNEKEEMFYEWAFEHIDNLKDDCFPNTKLSSHQISEMFKKISKFCPQYVIEKEVLEKYSTNDTALDCMSEYYEDELYSIAEEVFNNI